VSQEPSPKPPRPPRSDSQPQGLRLYAPPRLERLGTLAELTQGQNGSKWDSGHESPTKLGQG